MPSSAFFIDPFGLQSRVQSANPDQNSEGPNTPPPRQNGNEPADIQESNHYAARTRGGLKSVASRSYPAEKYVSFATNQKDSLKKLNEFNIQINYVYV